eukprot:3240108-Amphidinium_carterae.1
MSGAIIVDIHFLGRGNYLTASVNAGKVHGDLQQDGFQSGIKSNPVTETPPNAALASDIMKALGHEERL